jgi:hypothetical protein
MTTTDLRPTSQQQAVLDACVAGADVVIEAGAGTGKTSTLRFVAEALDRSTGLYVAYNRATADAARRVFPASVTCSTAHALAYSAVGYRYAHRLPAQAARMPSWSVAGRLGIGSPLPLGSDLLLTPAHQARIVMSTVERFCHSADTDISAVHVPAVHGVDEPAFAELTWRVVPLAQRAWRELQVPDSRLPFQHDHYLKLWQLSSPSLPFGYVMFDEAQDANPVTAAILQLQRRGQAVIVGDSCQAIYGWRGAVDAMTDWPCDVRLNLTRSFRFGPPIADEANKWLTALGAPYRLKGVRPQGSVVGDVANPEVIVCRTNAEAYIQARAAMDAGRRSALGGGAASELKALAAAALDLQAAGRTGYGELAAFRSWEAVQDYVRTDAAGADLAAVVRLIDKYGASSILGTVGRLSRVDRAEVIACTVHFAKGREWDRVVIAGDFASPGSGPVPRGDAMIAYVAVTRARGHLDRSGLAWIDSHPLAAARKETTMNQLPADPLGLAEAIGPRPYAGGRAQAESGSRIICNDYDAWRAVSSQPELGGLQLTRAWDDVRRHGLGDDPGPAAIRYAVLSHAAASLAQPGGSIESAVLDRLAGHARLHAGRLAATADEHFLRSRLAAPYQSWPAGARGGDRIIESDYTAWNRSGAVVTVRQDTTARACFDRMEEAWTEMLDVRRTDECGPGHEARAYSEVGDAAAELAGNYPRGATSAHLALLLKLATHARKHAIRLQATHEVRDGRDPVNDMTAEFQIRPYQGLPADVASLTAQAHTSEQAGRDDEETGARGTGWHERSASTGDGRSLSGRAGSGCRRTSRAAEAWHAARERAPASCPGRGAGSVPTTGCCVAVVAAVVRAGAGRLPAGLATGVAVGAG